MRIGVLALQGDVVEHEEVLSSLGVDAEEVRTKEELSSVDGLIIPGGESTTLMKLLEKEGLDKAIVVRYKEGMPIFGTCAGAILLAKEVVGKGAGNNQSTLKLIDMTIKRNEYGRQVDSFETEVELKGDVKPLKAIFIRAPVIERVGLEVERLAELDGRVVVAKYRHCLVATFHPELVGETRVHKLFLEMIKDNQQ
ncbi:MAG: pyridoxal 5'-phosphate synthase glutaminase subunit PdxT [DPANN group archaeon]|nr:pyridoxal 5'-phosphate synthase glutaminase subunit PdxT [DPANN group archaeon]